MSGVRGPVRPLSETAPAQRRVVPCAISASSSYVLQRPFEGKRPDIVARKVRYGDSEADSIVEKGPGRIIMLVERKTGFAGLRHVASDIAGATMRTVVHALHPITSRAHMFTWDNGRQFGEHSLIDLALDASSYYAGPCSTWRRGHNEELNELLRQHVRKGSDLGTYNVEAIQRIEDKLNRRPRKRPAFLKPQFLFKNSFNRRALRI